MDVRTVLKKSKTLRRMVYLFYSYYDPLLTLLSPTLNTKVLYKRTFGRKIDLKNPKTFNEKILKLKLDCYADDSLIKQCADKYAVRFYIENMECNEILVPLIGSYDKMDEIEWDKLPNSFVLKWNFGSGFNIICEDKQKLDIMETKQKMEKWRKSKYYLWYSEMQYKGVKKKIVVEKYLKPERGRCPDDYKVYCFNGRPLYVMLCVGRGEEQVKFLYYDRNFTFMRDFSYDGMNMPVDFELEKPQGFDELFYYAEKLSAPFKFVRADFYLVDGKVYFGELTFTPCGGLDNKKIPEIDILFGELLNID